MGTVLSWLKWQSCLVYLDDVVIFSTTFDQHVERLRTVLKAISSAGLTIKPQKCHFGFHELLFLGHVVSSEGIRPDPEKTAAVEKLPTKNFDGQKGRQTSFRTLRLLQTLCQKCFEDCRATDATDKGKRAVRLDKRTRICIQRATTTTSKPPGSCTLR